MKRIEKSSFSLTEDREKRIDVNSLIKRSVCTSTSIPSNKIPIPIDNPFSLGDELAQNNISLLNLDLPSKISNRLFQHQKEGVCWMYLCYLKKSGGLLGDDMGMGKTFQITSFLTGLMRINTIKSVLIVSPVSVLESWRRELHDYLSTNVKRSLVQVISADVSKKKRISILHDVQQSGYCNVIISSYSLVSGMIDEYSKVKWDYVILDEGHTIKNSATQVSKAVHRLQSKHRLLLTGTPVQNNLEELWTLLDWTTHGRLLGTKTEFIREYITPILAGQNPKASVMIEKKSQEVAQNLLKLIGPVFLQRKKIDHQETTKLTNKTELVVWIPLSSMQRRVYEDFLQGRAVQNALKRSSYPVEAINHLKTLCRHPLLVEASEKIARIKKTLLSSSSSSQASSPSTTVNKMAYEDEDDDFGLLINSFNDLNMSSSSSSSSSTAAAVQQLPKANASLFDIINRSCEYEEICAGSVKLRVLLKLTQRLHRGGHRMLVFSQSKLMLDIIQRVLAEKGLSSVRIDGSVTGRDRQDIIDSFNAGGSSCGSDSSSSGDTAEDDVDEEDDCHTGPSICLLTTRACGYGITLTGADRVIIFDPSWNPAEDRQAVDRAFRIGQRKDVIVYRFIMASTVEEKMYEKQVFKDGVRVLTEKGVASARYFSDEETKKLFKLGPAEYSEVYKKRLPVDIKLSTVSDTGGVLAGVLGYSRHDAMYDEGNSGSSNNIGNGTNINKSNNNNRQQEQASSANTKSIDSYFHQNHAPTSTAATSSVPVTATTAITPSLTSYSNYDPNRTRIMRQPDRFEKNDCDYDDSKNDNNSEDGSNDDDDDEEADNSVNELIIKLNCVDLCSDDDEDEDNSDQSNKFAPLPNKIKPHINNNNNNNINNHVIDLVSDCDDDEEEEDSKDNGSADDEVFVCDTNISLPTKPTTNNGSMNRRKHIIVSDNEEEAESNHDDDDGNDYGDNNTDPSYHDDDNYNTYDDDEFNNDLHRIKGNKYNDQINENDTRNQDNNNHQQHHDVYNNINNSTGITNIHPSSTITSSSRSPFSPPRISSSSSLPLTTSPTIISPPSSPRLPLLSFGELTAMKATVHIESDFISPMCNDNSFSNDRGGEYDSATKEVNNNSHIQRNGRNKMSKNNSNHDVIHISPVPAASENMKITPQPFTQSPTISSSSPLILPTQSSTLKHSPANVAVGNRNSNGVVVSSGKKSLRRINNNNSVMISIQSSIIGNENKNIPQRNNSVTGESDDDDDDDDDFDFPLHSLSPPVDHHNSKHSNFIDFRNNSDGKTNDVSGVNCNDSNESKTDNRYNCTRRGFGVGLVELRKTNLFTGETSDNKKVGSSVSQANRIDGDSLKQLGIPNDDRSPKNHTTTTSNNIRSHSLTSPFIIEQPSPQPSASHNNYINEPNSSVGKRIMKRFIMPFSSSEEEEDVKKYQSPVWMNESRNNNAAIAAVKMKMSISSSSNSDKRAATQLSSSVDTPLLSLSMPIDTHQIIEATTAARDALPMAMQTPQPINKIVKLPVQSVAMLSTPITTKISTIYPMKTPVSAFTYSTGRRRASRGSFLAFRDTPSTCSSTSSSNDTSESRSGGGSTGSSNNTSESRSGSSNFSCSNTSEIIGGSTSKSSHASYIDDRLVHLTSRQSTFSNLTTDK